MSNGPFSLDGWTIIRDALETARPEGERKLIEPVLSFDFLVMLDELEAALKAPPKEGYSRREARITIEDVCDAGAEVESLWAIEQPDIDMLRASVEAARSPLRRPEEA